MLKGKKITTLNLDSDLVDKAQKYGLSLSKWVNSKLYEFFYGASNNSTSTDDSSHTTDLIVHMSDDFRTWLKANRADKRYIESLESYLTKYFTGLVLNTPQNIVEYISRMKTTSKYPILALRLYIKYLEETDQITAEHSQHLKKVLKVKKSKPDTYVPTDDRVKEAYHKLKDDRDKLIFEILAYSGVRVTEMVKMLKEFEPNNLVKNEKFGRYSLNYSRGQKRSYYIYMPLEVSDKVKRFYKIGNKEITKIIGLRSGLSPKYLRKWFFNKTIMSGVPESVADFYEGRSPATVGSANYMDKTRQADHYYEKVVDILREAIE
ncbi:MAG: integrase [Thermoplasmataceae archaeon]|jgi:intergrase/recombinase